MALEKRRISARSNSIRHRRIAGHLAEWAVMVVLQVGNGIRYG